MSSVKNKIRAGTIFLFVLVILSGAFSIYYLLRLKTDSANIIKANYESLEYAQKMQVGIDSLIEGKSTYIDTLSFYLTKQENNITEPGEKELTQNLRTLHNRLTDGDTNAFEQLRTNLHNIFILNMTAIKAKSLNSEKSANDALTYLIAIVSVIILVGLTFVYNFPSIITN
ncbi:MAG: PAS domain-containing sensor histidine kinase, partial [Flavitalea sp.]